MYRVTLLLLCVLREFPVVMGETLMVLVSLAGSVGLRQLVMDGAGFAHRTVDIRR